MQEHASLLLGTDLKFPCPWKILLAPLRIWAPLTVVYFWKLWRSTLHLEAHPRTKTIKGRGWQYIICAIAVVLPWCRRKGRLWKIARAPSNIPICSSARKLPCQSGGCWIVVVSSCISGCAESILLTKSMPSRGITIAKHDRVLNSRQVLFFMEYWGLQMLLQSFNFFVQCWPATRP